MKKLIALILCLLMCCTGITFAEETPTEAPTETPECQHEWGILHQDSESEFTFWDEYEHDWILTETTYRKCKKCNQEDVKTDVTKQRQNHDFVDGICDCGYECPHNWKSAGANETVEYFSISDEKHKKNTVSVEEFVCSRCGMTRTEKTTLDYEYEAHTYTDGKCTYCGETDLGWENPDFPEIVRNALLEHGYSPTTDGLKGFQANYGLAVTGTVTEETLELLAEMGYCEHKNTEKHYSVEGWGENDFKDNKECYLFFRRLGLKSRLTRY